MSHVVGENGTIFVSTNTGVDRESQSSGTGEHLNAGIGPVSGTSDVAVAGGSNGVLLKTTDGGNIWTPVSSGATQTIHSFADGPAGRLYLTGMNGMILESL